MCLYSELIKNPRFKETKKNGGVIPAVLDVRTLQVPIGCGNCIECRRQKSREWEIRLIEDIKDSMHGKMVTLTISDEYYYELNQEIKKELQGYDRDNAIVTLAMRRFNERYRKTEKKAIRHWLVSELGHEGTENIHLHGILWTEMRFEDIRKIWKYGYIYPRKDEQRKNYVNNQTVRYCVKYIHKIDKHHENYKSIVLSSAGIGENYITSGRAKIHKFKGKDTIEHYRTPEGYKVALPKYWRNKIWTDDEKELLWTYKLDKKIRWINKEKVDIRNGYEDYFNILKYHQKLNRELGYKGKMIKNQETWDKIKYEKELRILKQNERLERERQKRIQKIANEFRRMK